LLKFNWNSQGVKAMGEIEDLLSELKNEYQGSPPTPPIPSAPRVEELEVQRQERRQQALEQKARNWLMRLNPRSEEGQWFEEFAYSYESRLKAAVDYLAALREVGIK
jgi:hypothetical protein